MERGEQTINSVVYVSDEPDDPLYPNVITEVDSVVSKAKAIYDVAAVDPGVIEGSTGVNHLALAIGVPAIACLGLAIGVGVALARKKRRLEISLQSIDDRYQQEVKQNDSKQS